MTGVYPALHIDNPGWRGWTKEIETYANSGGAGFLYNALLEKIKSGIFFVISPLRKSLTFSDTLGSSNELLVDQNILIHLDSNREIPIGSPLTTPPKNLFHVEKAEYGRLKVKLLNPPNLSVPYQPLEVDQRQDLTLYQTYRKGDTYQYEPHR